MVKLHPEIYAAIWIESKVNDLDFYLVAGLIQVESAFNPHALGDGGLSHGLMQLHEKGAGSGVPPWRLHSIANNVRIGCAYLRVCIDATGNVEDGLSAYNQGLAGWKAGGTSLNYESYVQPVLTWRYRFADSGIERLEYPEFYVQGIGE